MTRFERHITRRFLTGYLFFVGALIVFFIVLHYVEYVDDFFDRGATMREIFLVYYPSYIPEIVRLTSPLALFLACIYLTGKLAQELQLVALQTTGVSLYRLLRPYLAVGLLVTMFMFWFNGWIVPVTNQTVLTYDQQYLRDAPQQIDVSNIHRQNRPGSILSVGYYDDEQSTAHRVSLQDFSSADRLVQRIDANEMEWLDSLSVWRLQAPVIQTFDSTGVASSRSEAMLDTTLNIFPRSLARTERDVASMTIPIAGDYVAELRRSGTDQLGRPLVGFYSKFTYPLANFIVVLLGVPLAAVRRRGGQAVQISIGLAVAFVYLAVMKLTEPFGYTGELHPLAAATLPHLLFFAAALALLWNVRK